MTTPGPGTPPTGLREAVDWLRARLAHGGLGRRVVDGTARTIIVVGAGAAASFAVQLGLARLMGKESYGVYVLVFGWFAVAQVVGKLEVDSITIRFVASYVSTRRWDMLRGLLDEGRRLVLVASTLVALIGAGLTFALSEQLNGNHPDYANALLLACLALPAASLLRVDSAALQGFHQYARAQLPQNLIRPLVLAFVVAIIVLTGRRLVAPGAVVASIVAVLVAAAIAAYWRAKATPMEVFDGPPAFERRHWARTASPFFAASLGHLIISQQADILIVGTYLDAAQAGIYGAAAQLTLPMGLALSSVTYVVQPIVADLFARKELVRMQSLIRVSTWGSRLLALPIAGGLILLGPWLLGLYGTGFRAGYSVMVILMLAQVVHGISGHLAGYLLTMTEHERAAAVITIVSALLNAVLALILTPIYGAVGTASATLVAALVRSLVMRTYIRREMGLAVPTL